MMNRSKPDTEVATSCIALSIYTANPEYNVRASFRLVQAPIPPGAVRRGGSGLYSIFTVQLDNSGGSGTSSRTNILYLQYGHFPTSKRTVAGSIPDSSIFKILESNVICPLTFFFSNSTVNIVYLYGSSIIPGGVARAPIQIYYIYSTDFYPDFEPRGPRIDPRFQHF